GFSDYIIHRSHIPYADWASSAWNEDSLLFNLVNRVKSSGKPDRYLGCTGLDFSRREFTVALVDCPGHLLQGKTIILQLVLLHINLYLSRTTSQQINFRHTADLLESRQHLLFYQLIKRPGFKVRYRCQLYDRQKVTGRNFFDTGNFHLIRQVLYNIVELSLHFLLHFVNIGAHVKLCSNNRHSFHRL